MFFPYILSYQANGDMAFGETKNSVIIESSIFCQEKADLLTTGDTKIYLSVISSIFRNMLEVRSLPDMHLSIPLITVWGEAGCEPYPLE